ncbi:transcriptional regulator [Cnuibacter physcomitrellae]|uniref:Transcriptional regulator n=1 Tax=Cnuibacter physcomitrellae TaxID=1619308 RepID=A0A1X9LS72_9MICO|nr:helix-turn-helix transcriptional regulator [Cnuibacter physcomitrellae]ARJ04750.1 transcriptional regulator [Cnuibacter physcomitrellae]GGI41969.1 transcriptional regulator [Cnuibacter physcomitrellae]
MEEFASVLRAWRDRVDPVEVGLPAGGVRRAPGLRREELAALAGVSVDYVVRLEQGRSTHPSPQLLGALANALRLSDEERDHLHRVAGVAPPPATVVPRHVAPGVQRLIDRLGDVPLAVFTATWDILLWNGLWAALTGDPSGRHGLDANLVWRHFTAGHPGTEFDDRHEEEFSADLVADLRAALGRYPADAALADLVARLRAASPDFAERWSTARIAEHRSSRKTMTDTPVGRITLDCDVLTVPGSDLRIVVYTAVPGSEDASRLDLLRVTGLQRLHATAVEQAG